MNAIARERHALLARFDEPLRGLAELCRQGKAALPTEWVRGLQSVGVPAEPSMTPEDAISAVWRQAALIVTSGSK